MDIPAVGDSTQQNTLLLNNLKQEVDENKLPESLQIDDAEDIIKEEIDLKTELANLEIQNVTAENQPVAQTENSVSEIFFVKGEIVSEQESEEYRNFAYAISENHCFKQKPLHICTKCVFKCYLREHYQEHLKHHRQCVNYCEQCGCKTTTKAFFTRHLNLQHRSEFPCHSQFNTYDASKYAAYNKKTSEENQPKKHVEKDAAALERSLTSFKCKDCELDFCDENLLKEHVQKIHSPNKSYIYKCHYCSYTTCRLSALTNHKSSHRKKRFRKRKKFFCECGYKTASKHSLTYHKNVHARQKKCELCEFVTTNEQRMERHVNSHFIDISGSPPQLVCSKCEFQTDTLPALGRHMVTHSSNYCTKCQKNFVDSAALLEHKKTHAKDNSSKPFLCSECGYQTAYKCHLKQHQMTVHATKPKLYVCNECNYFARDSYALKRHSVKHSTERLLKCNQCEGTFKNTASLREHKKVHLSEKPYKCNLCSYSAIRRGSIQLHLRKHTGEKPFACPDCDYCAAYASNLQSHRRMVHLKIKPHHCAICGYSATEKGQLKRHMRMHLKEKYKCSDCIFEADSRVSLKAHKLKVHEGKLIYQCASCDYAAVSRANLRSHIRTHLGKKSHSCAKCNFTCDFACRLKEHQRRMHHMDGEDEEKELKLEVKEEEGNEVEENKKEVKTEVKEEVETEEQVEQEVKEVEEKEKQVMTEGEEEVKEEKNEVEGKEKEVKKEDNEVEKKRKEVKTEPEEAEVEEFVGVTCEYSSSSDDEKEEKAMETEAKLIEVKIENNGSILNEKVETD